MNDNTPIETVVDRLLTTLSSEERSRTVAELKANFVLNWGLLTRINSDRIRRLNLATDVARVLQEAVAKAALAPRPPLASPAPEPSPPPTQAPSLQSTAPEYRRALSSGVIPEGHYRAPIIFDRNHSGSEDEDSEEDSLDELLATWGFPKPKKEPGHGHGGGGSASKCPWIFQQMMLARKKEQGGLAEAPKKTETIHNWSSSSEESDSEESESDSTKAKTLQAAPPVRPPAAHSFSIEGLSPTEIESAKLQCPHFAFAKKPAIAGSTSGAH